MKIGEIITAEGDIELNAGRDCLKIPVINKGDRPVQVGSHFHFAEVNAELDFDRKQAVGYRLDIPAGMAVRFEPNDEKWVNLVKLAGERKVFGQNNLVNGSLEQ